MSEAAWIRKDASLYGIDAVLNLAKPQDAGTVNAAEAAVEHIVKQLEGALVAGAQVPDAELPCLEPDGLRARLKDAAENHAKLAQIARQWTHNFTAFMKPDGVATRREEFMYPPVSAFILYVQRHIKDLHAPSDFDEGERVDIALFNCPASDDARAHLGRDTLDFFAIIECKKHQDSKVEYEEALDQLIDYTRHVYRVQYNRRFAWALSVCGTNVYAVAMLHDTVLVSPAMDVAKPAGRKRFVELLVNWAVCDDVQAGYDPTIVLGPNKNHYRIECRDEDGNVHWYKTTECVVAADSMIGRHTRCFLARPDGVGGGNNDVVVIKDAFAASSPPPNDKVRNEISHLRKIKKEFEGKKLDFMYPELVHGGDVVLPTGGSRVSNIAANSTNGFDDNTDGIFSLMGATREDVPLPSDDGVNEERSWTQQPYRVHRRLAMKPYGGHLKKGEDPAELIVVLAEAMRCHTAIHTQCGILHRDISPNNILVVDGSDGLLHGLLIDFDYAIPLDEDGYSGRPGRSGSLPYMSIGNLEYAGQMQSALDDWEALLYTLCMWGTRGLTSDDRNADKRGLTKLPISQWSVDHPSVIASNKRRHMHSAESFKSNILDCFHSKCKGLKPLANDLHTALFLHKECAGAAVQRRDLDIPDADNYNPNIDSDTQSEAEEQDASKAEDPLVKRRKHESDIVQALSKMMAKHDRLAKGTLQKALSKQTAAGPSIMQDTVWTMETLNMEDGSAMPTPMPQTPTPASRRGRSRR
ncbi:hypothetical protein IWQ56_000390 [Coemansia nantahalensis]|nr:hypothetical protein IWQ56_000390 [Coemansia nantahalensis]